MDDGNGLLYGLQHTVYTISLELYFVKKNYCIR